MVSLSRLFHKTDEREKPATAATAPAEPACAPTAKATVAPVELPQEFLDKFPGGMLRYKAEEAGAIDRVSSGLVRLFGCSDAEQFRALTGNTFKGIVHPDDWEWVSASISEQMERSDSDYVRYRIIRAHGRHRARAREGRAASGERAAGNSHGALQRRALRYRVRHGQSPRVRRFRGSLRSRAPARGFRGEPPLPKAVRAGYYFPRPDAAHDTDRRELTRRF